MKKALVIGGMAAGCKAAARLKRLKPDYEITIIEKRSFVSYGACGMPLFASGDVDAFLDLAKTPWGEVRDAEFFGNVKDVKVLTETKALKIDPDAKKVECENLKTNEKFELDYDYLIVATGAKASTPPFPVPDSDKISTFHNPLDAKKFRQKAQVGAVEKAVIVGGGFIGTELAEALVSLWGIDTYLVEMENRLLPKSIDPEISRLLEKVYAENDVELRLNTAVEKIELDDEDPVVHLTSGEKIKSDYVFLCLGVRPETTLAVDAGIEIGSEAIKVDLQMRTNLPDVYAAGDCVEIPNFASGKNCCVPLGSLANRQGRVIADAIAGLDSTFKGAAGTISIKVFDMIVAAAGLNEALAKKHGIDYDVVSGSWYDRPDYHPDNKVLFGKALYEKKTTRIIGLQLAGYGEVTRYVDAFSYVLSRRGTAEDLLDFEHAYTPPHSGPINPLNHLGAMIQAQEFEGVDCVEFEQINLDDFEIIDVRTEEEIEAAGYSERAEKISPSEIRSKIGEMEKTKKYLVVCQKGPRSYEVARIMKQNGFEAVYLGGGAQLALQMLDDPDE